MFSVGVSKTFPLLLLPLLKGLPSAGRQSLAAPNGCGRLGGNGMSRPFVSGSAEQRHLEVKKLGIGEEGNEMK